MQFAIDQLLFSIAHINTNQLCDSIRINIRDIVDIYLSGVNKPLDKLLRADIHLRNDKVVEFWPESCMLDADKKYESYIKYLHKSRAYIVYVPDDAIKPLLNHIERILNIIAQGYSL